MSDLRKAAQQALEALDFDPRSVTISCVPRLKSAAEVLRAALAQPERKPLTDEEMDKLFGYETERGAVPGHLAVAFVRIVERAHGIGEHNA